MSLAIHFGGQAQAAIKDMKCAINGSMMIVRFHVYGRKALPNEMTAAGVKSAAATTTLYPRRRNDPYLKLKAS